MRPMTTQELAVASVLIGILLVTFIAVILPRVAAFLPTQRRALLTVSLCLWCLLAGFTLSSALWSFMVDTNHRYVRTQLEQMPPDALARDFKPHTMAMLLFFVLLDGLGRKLCYATVVIPLALIIVAWRKAHSAKPVPGVSDADTDLYG